MYAVRLVLVAGATIAALVAGSSADTIISVQWGRDGRAFMEAEELAGAPGVRVGNWNNLVDNAFGPTFGDDEAVLYEDGGVVLGGFTITPDDDGFLNRGSGTFVNDTALFNTVKDVINPWDVVVSNVPFAEYELYLYRRDENALRAGGFSVDGGATTYWARGGAGNPADDGSGYVLSTDTDPGTGTVVDGVDQGNYVVISGLTSSSFTLTASAIGDDIPRNKFAGFQIVQIPEPGTFALMAMTGGMLFVLRRRNRTV